MNAILPYLNQVKLNNHGAIGSISIISIKKKKNSIYRL